MASNGAEVLRTQLTSDPATSRWDFAPTKAMSTYITTILAGPYFKAEDAWTGTLGDGTALEVPLALYCRASMAKSFDAEALFGLTKKGCPSSTSSSTSPIRGANTTRPSCPSTTSAPWKIRVS